MSGEVYRACRKVIEKAVAGGVCTEREAWHMTPSELLGMSEARRAAQVRRMKDMDMLAWLIGQYVAVGVNSPGRYPRQPDRVRETAMGDDDMRQFMREMAGRGEEVCE